EGPRSEIEIVADLAGRVLADATPIDWPAMRHASRIREAIGRIVPGLEAIGEIDRTKQEFQIPGRTFHEPKFATPGGRAKLFTHELPELTGEMAPVSGANGTGHNGHAPQLRLMTVRSEGQFNTVV